MISAARLISRLNLTAAATLTIILAGLLAEGANTPSSAALFSGVLLATAFAAVALSPSGAIAHALRANAVSVGAAGLFIALALATALPLPGDLAARLAHPDAARFGWSSPAMSLAPGSTIEGVVTFLGPAAAFVLGALARTRGSRSQIGAWICALAIALAIYALQLFAAGISQGGGRLDAHLGTANAAAATFGALALFAMAGAIDKSVTSKGEEGGAARRFTWLLAPTRAPLAIAAFVLCIACAVLTLSRGGLAATGLAFAVFVGLLALRAKDRTRLLALGPAAAFGAVAIVMMSLGADSVLGRLSDVGEALQGRQELLAPHWYAFLASPLWGHGLNTFHELNAMAATPDNWDSLRIVGAAHNIYVQALEETGVIGLALFALMLAPPLWRALTRALYASKAPHWDAALYSAGLLFLVHGVMDFDLQIPAIAALFAFWLGAFGTPRPGN